MNRKDRLPEETVKIISEILAKINVHAKIVEEKSFENQWFSIRLELLEFPGIGSNGKGDTYSFALASAYAELMERLESGLLLNSLYGGVRKWFPLANLNETSYYSLYDNRMVSIDPAMVNICSGSNGIAAGNTYEEAMCQCIGEIIERYVINLIYSVSDRELSDLFAPVNVLPLCSEYNKSRLLLIEKKGFNTFFVTTRRALPVLIFILQTKTKYQYKYIIASDENLDICVSRCIDECFQGYSFDVSFKFSLNKIYDYSQEQPQLKRRLKTKQFYNNGGALPSVFWNILEMNTINCACSDIIKTNKETAKIMLNYLKEIAPEIYIKDYSFLGFPCLRLFCPGISDILSISKETDARLLNQVKNLHASYFIANDMAMCIDAMEEIGKIDPFFPIDTVINLYEQKSSFFKLSIYELITLYHLYEDNICLAESCYNKYRSFYETGKKETITKIYIDCLKNNIKFPEIYIHYLSDTSSLDLQYLYMFMRSYQKTDYLTPCASCDICNEKLVCSVETWKNIIKNILTIKNKYNGNYTWIEQLSKELRNG